MRTSTIASATIALLCHSLASAQQTAPAPIAATETEPIGAWSIGTGIELSAGQSQANDLFTMMLLGSMGGYGFLFSSLVSEPRSSLVFFVEYQLFDRLALVVQANAGLAYLQNQNVGSSSFLLPDHRFDWSAGAAVGCRFIVNPGGLVEFSVLGVPHIDYASNSLSWNNGSGNPSGSTTTIDARALGGGIELGLAVEKRLLPNLDLRLQTSVLDVNGRWSTLEQTPPATPAPNTTTGTPSQTRVGVDLKIAPTLELRLHF